MGKLDNVSLRAEQLTIADVGIYYRDTVDALQVFYSNRSDLFQARFFSYTSANVIDELNERLEELDVSCSLTVLSILEAMIRVDYLLRGRLRKKDDVSKAMRPIYKSKKQNARLDEDILDTWKKSRPSASTLIGELKGAFHYRHWLAHGRYWEPKLANKSVDFISLYKLAGDIIVEFQMLSLIT